MRKIEFLPVDFYHFKLIANQYSLWFLSNFLGGIYVVEANSELLESIGY